MGVTLGVFTPTAWESHIITEGKHVLHLHVIELLLNMLSSGGFLRSDADHVPQLLAHQLLTQEAKMRRCRCVRGAMIFALLVRQSVAEDGPQGGCFFTWAAISTQWRQNSATLGPNHLTVGPKAWRLKVAARRVFFKMDLVIPKSFFRMPLLAATFGPYVSGSTVR